MSTAVKERRVAIIGCGAAGLAAAHLLGSAPSGENGLPRLMLTLFEASSQLGGHANTVDVRSQAEFFGEGGGGGLSWRARRQLGG